MIRPYEDWFNVTTLDSAKKNVFEANVRKGELLSILYVPILLFGFFGGFAFLIYFFWDQVCKQIELRNKKVLSIAVLVIVAAFFVMLGWLFHLNQFENCFAWFGFDEVYY